VDGHIVRGRRRKRDVVPSLAQASSRPPVPVVAIGGGTGLPAILAGLADAMAVTARVPAHLTGVVTMTDDGGSSGRLRREIGMLPPGDIRNCLVALAAHDSPLRDLLQHRFTTSPALKGHALGNLLLAALVEMTGDFCTAIDRLGALVQLRGRVLPATIDHVALVGEFHGGATIHGETAIVAQRRPLRRIRLDHQPRALPQVVDAIDRASLIVVGPGSLYTSILPNLLITDVAAAMRRSGAARVLVANLMTEPGETDGFTLEKHLDVIHEHAGPDLFDYVLVNRRTPSPAAIARYASQSAAPIALANPEAKTLRRIRIVRQDLAWETHRGKVRHAPAAVANAVLTIAKQHATLRRAG